MQFVLLNSIQVLVDLTLSSQIVYYKYRGREEKGELNEEKEEESDGQGTLKGQLCPVKDGDI